MARGEQARNATIYVRCVKTDLLDAIKKVADDELSFSVKDGVGYVDNAV